MLDTVAELHRLKKSDLTEIKALNNPPRLLGTVMGALLTLLGKDDTSWKAVRKEMTDPKFVDKIVCLDKDRISPKVLAKVRTIIRDTDPDFNYDKVKSVSAAGASIARHILAIERYCTQIG